MERTNVWTPRAESCGARREWVMNWEIGIDMYTLICVKWITNKNQLYKKITKIEFKKKKRNGRIYIFLLFFIFTMLMYSLMHFHKLNTPMGPAPRWRTRTLAPLQKPGTLSPEGSTLLSWFAPFWTLYKCNHAVGTLLYLASCAQHCLWDSSIFCMSHKTFILFAVYRLRWVTHHNSFIHPIHLFQIVLL